MTHFAILGAGTAGLACAIALSRQGRRVTVFERHPRLAPVGAGLLIQPSGLRALDALGVGRAFTDVSVPIGRLEGLSHRGWRLVDVSYPEPHGRAISRHALTQVLAEEATALGAELRLGTEVQSLAPAKDAVELRLPGHSETFDAVIVANGSGSALGVECGLSAPATLYPWGALHALFEVEGWPRFDVLQQRYRGTRKMFGLLPTAQHGTKQVLSVFWSLPLDQHATWQNTAIDQWRQELTELWPEAEPVVAQFQRHSQFSLATYRHAWPKRLAQGRICLVGDAAHAMSPQLGLGATLAVGDALSIAQALSETASVEDAFARYQQRRARAVKKFQLYSRLLTPCFQSKLPGAWRDLAFATGRWIPGMNALMLKSLDG